MEIINVVKAEYVGNLSIRLWFNDNTMKVINVGDFLRKKPHPQTNKYLEERNFLKFKIEDGNIVWGKNADVIFPVAQLHEGVIA